MNTDKIDIFSTDFFAEDPFADEEPEWKDPSKKNLAIPRDLYTLPELSCPDYSSYKSEESLDNFAEELIHADNQEKGYRVSRSDDSTKSVDILTSSTCRSTSYESTEQTTDKLRSSPSPTRDIDSSPCSNPTCIIQKVTINQQEEKMCFLRRKLQDYADLCELHNIGHDLLTNHETTPIPTIKTSRSGSVHEERTYADFLGPWDIPFHVECDSLSTDEYSGITFAQHPCKIKEIAPRIRSCPNDDDDDDDLPLIRPRRHLAFTATAERESMKMVGQTSMQDSSTTSQQEAMEGTDLVPLSSDDFVSDLLPLHPGRRVSTGSQTPPLQPKRKAEDDFFSQLGEIIEDEDLHPSSPKEHRVRKMKVIVERKYGRQKALYSGTIDPTTGCPQGVGSLQFVNSGDVYMGEIAYGEMHGKGTYCHRKTGRLFRGTFVRNTYLGTAHQERLEC